MRLRTALASFFNEYFGSRYQVKPDQLLVATGVTAITDLVTWAICEEGDGILVPQPYYTAFSVDFHERSRGHVIPMSFQDLPGYQSVDDIFDPEFNRLALEKTLQKSLQQGIRPRGFMLTNPHNPLGKCYPPETVEVIARFCNEHNLHLISDEIYARSVFSNPSNPDAIPFTSVLSMDMDKFINPSLLHVMYGASKDFCANGTRLGVLQSRNEGILQAISTVLVFSWPSYIVQDCWASILEDKDFLSSFFKTNEERLQQSYTILTSFLDHEKVSYFRGGNAGVFLWVDLRRFFGDVVKELIESGKISEVLKATSPDAEKLQKREQQLLDTFLENGVNIGKGSNFATEEFGWFRVTFTTGEGMLLEGLKRFRKALGNAT